jgi:trehalose/maltose hydrolase-like predicted phosphorylase
MRQPALEAWAEAALTPTETPGWVLRQDQFDPAREHEVESRFAIGNGFIGVRGARSASRGPVWISWLRSLNWMSWPRTFVAGLFDTPDTHANIPLLVPAPDWLRLRLLLDGQPLFIHSGELLAHKRILELRRGLLLSDWSQRDTAGRVVRVRTLRLVSQVDRGVGLQVARIEIDQPVDVTLQSWLELAGAGLEPVSVRRNSAVWRTAASQDRGKYLGLGSTACLSLAGQLVPPRDRGKLKQAWSWQARPGQAATFLRAVTMTRGDMEHDPGQPARLLLARTRQLGPRRLLAAHEQAWGERWTASDVIVGGDEQAQRAFRFAVYHLLSAANPEDDRVSISARALTGDAYFGHVFWDTESYLLPFYTLTWPAAARALLMYRYHTLGPARAKAARLGYRGALYAWESADTGEETTPDHLVGPDGMIVPVLCGVQEHHISADIAYAVWRYWDATHDESFLLDAGAEILLETARFWASRATREPDGLYHVRGVIGPDEYHENVDDNAYTNGMAGWNLEQGLAVAELLRQRWPERWSGLAGALGLTSGELAEWDSVRRCLFRGRTSHQGVLEQFAGYFGLEEIELAGYRERRAPIDVVLGPERTRHSQVLKQADVVMLLALLPDRFEPPARTANFRYYEPRCGHGSSLSRAMHALVAARIGELDVAERYFRETAAIDLEDTTGTEDAGVHIAALGGLWQAAILGFAGLRLRPDGLDFAPALPASWSGLSFRVQWRQRQVHVQLEQRSRQLTARLERGEPLVVSSGAECALLSASQPFRACWVEAGRAQHH